MKVPYEKAAASTEGLVSEIGMLHRRSVTYYEDAARALADKHDKPAAFFADLAEHHKRMTAQLDERLAQFQAGVHPPARQGIPVVKQREADFGQALNNHNVYELATIAADNENHISDAYRHALANRTLKGFEYDELEQQHEVVLDWVRRAERFKTVPQEELPEED